MRQPDGRSEAVRLIGIDTPERSPRDGGGPECYADPATRRPALVARGRVRLVADREARDRFGRLLAYVHRIGDDVLVNEVLVREGFARTLEIEPNTRMAPRLAAAETDARRAGRGLWSACEG